MALRLVPHDQTLRAAKAFTEAFTQRWGKPPDNQAWGDYNAMKILAQAMAETGSTESDPLVEHLEKGAKFDVMKGREGYFRDWDHQLMMEMYTMTPKQNEEMTDQWDIMTIGEAVPAADQTARYDRAEQGGERLHVRLIRLRQRRGRRRSAWKGVGN